MLDHDWTFESLSAYLAGGLSADERREIEQHVAACDECARALHESRELEQMMDGLFTNARPDADLEARALAKVRQSRLRRASIMRFVASAAAVLVLGLVGAAMQAIAFSEMWMPGESRTVAQNNLKHTRLMAVIDDSRSMNAEPANLDDKKETFGVVDADPAVLEYDTDIQYNGKRMEKVSVPGGHKLSDEFSLTRTGSLMLGLDGRTGLTRERTLHEAGGFGFQVEKAEVDGKLPLLLDMKKAGGLGALKLGDGPMAGEKKPGQWRGVSALVTNGELASKDYYKADPKAPPGKLEPPKESRTPILPAAPESAATITTLGAKLGYAGGGAGLKAEDPPVQTPPKVEPAGETELKIIYTGEMSFEIESFDDAIKTVKTLTDGIKGAFKLKEDRTKQENGKTRGYIVVRVPPKSLDKLIDDLRRELGKVGELKSQHVGSQDVTKQYTDTESELKAARLVEARLSEIIKTGKGDIKDLVAAETALGTWRTKIEKMEGEIRYYKNQVALSTLTITLFEKDLGTPASLVVTETVKMRIEVDDVKKALDAAVDAVKTFKGRIIRAEMKQHKAGQFEAILHAEVPPAQKDPFGKKLGGLGVVSENESTQKTQAEGGSGKPGKLDPRVSDVVFEVTLNNIVNIQPRHAVTLVVATKDVAVTYKKLKDELALIAKTQVRADNLNEQDKLRITAQLDFNVPTDKKADVDKLIAGLGHELKKTTVQAAVTEIATDQKFGYSLSLFGPGSIAPREVVRLKIEVKDVDKKVAELKENVLAGKGRVADANVARHENGQVTAQLVFDVSLAVQDLIVLKVKDSGNLLSQEAARNPNVPENDLATAQIVVTLQGVFAGKQPREKISMNIEVAEVSLKAADIKEMVRASKGRIADEKSSRQPNGQVNATFVIEAPLAEQEKLVQEFKGKGRLVSFSTARNPSVPDNDLATAQITLTLAEPTPIVDSDSGPGWLLRKGLSVSFYIFGFCIIAILAGLSALVPIGGAIYGVFKGIRWMWPGEKSQPAASAKPAPPV